MAVSLASNDLYGGVVLTGFLMAMEYLMTMEITCIINRRRHFSQQFLKEHFGEEHMNAFGHQIKGGGYPDHGSGKYGEKLSYKAWVEFANSQRSYYNYLELIFPVLFFLFIGGLVYPWATIIQGIIYIVARLFYAIGYNSSKGATGRYLGALIGHLVFLALFVTAVIATLRIAEAF